MRKLLQDRSFRLSIVVSSVFLATGVAFLLFDLVDYGLSLFVALPIILGIPLGLLANARFAVYGALIASLVFCTLMIALGIEFFACILMSLPLVLGLAFITAIVVRFLRKRRKKKEEQRLLVLLLPLLAFLVAVPVERLTSSHNAVGSEVTTIIDLPYTPLQVYDAIKSVDTLVAEKSFLMHLGLPVPQKCVLEREAIGGLRVCYFDGGTIHETVTQLEPGKILAMDVTGYDLMGLEWLGFDKAIYTFEGTAEGCRLTRITSFSSSLRPRFYWDPVEKLAISDEHDYVFNNLTKDLRTLFGN
jgi:hypothetical protein